MLRKQRRLFFALLLIFILLPFTGRRMFAANPQAVKKANANVLTGGKFVRVGGRLTYRLENGSIVKNTWARIDGSVYRFNNNGHVMTGTFFWKKHRYYADKKGRVYIRRLVKSGGATLYYGETGAMVQGKWKTIHGRTYYFGADGKLAKNCWVGNYYVNSKGLRRKNCWVDGYYLDGSGLCVEKADVSELKKSGTQQEREGKERLIIVGASRVVQMASAVDTDDRVIYLAKGAEGYAWLANIEIAPLRRCLSAYPYSTVVMQMGNNDVIPGADIKGIFSKYAVLYQKLMNDYPGVSFYFMDVLPGKWGDERNVLRKEFNSLLQKQFPRQYIGGYTYLMRTGYGFRTITDIQHYDKATYRRVWSYILKKTGWK